MEFSLAPQCTAIRVACAQIGTTEKCLMWFCQRLESLCLQVIKDSALLGTDNQQIFLGRTAEDILDVTIALVDDSTCL